MQLMCDAISVLGSRHGLLLDPIRRECQLLRFATFDALEKFELRAGVMIDGRELCFPFCTTGESFRFVDQRITPCSISFIGIDAASTVKVTFTLYTPFRPRDAAFSTTPVIGLRLTASLLPGSFRWERKTQDIKEVELFLQVNGDTLDIAASDADDGVHLHFTQQISGIHGAIDESMAQHDALLATHGARQGTRFQRRVPVQIGMDSPPLDVAWCSYSAPVLQVHGIRYPFKYGEQFSSLASVMSWARENPTALADNATRVDGIIGQNNCGASVNHLLAQTLHAWLADSWWITRDGADWFSVWEGSCYYHSTVDVEYTQAPFYLAVWPELLGYELDFWPEFAKDGTLTLGEHGAGTRFLSHDTGSRTRANGQEYPHEMEVEETTNYLILSIAYWKRSGDDSYLKKHARIIEQFLAFLSACDTTGSGIPDMGVANTIDDASPAVQFGREQVYLAVKTLAAYMAGAEIMQKLGDTANAAKYQKLATIVRARIEQQGWLGDHYATLLEKGGELIDPWSGKQLVLEEIPGWDAAHIYTQNGIALFDMIGLDTGLNRDRLQTDLRIAAQRCLREYGCIHSEYEARGGDFTGTNPVDGLVGASANPGWISMNMLRDIAAFYRGVDLRALAERYWDWQVLTNTQEMKLFFETFNGNNLCFYPRGIAVWGYFDALVGLVIDRTRNIMISNPTFPQLTVPRLYDANWAAGTCEIMRS